MNTVTFENPPSVRRGRPTGTKNGVWVERLTPLVRRPGRWARVHETHTWRGAIEAARNIRQGRVVIPDGEFESRAAVKDGRFYVYARFLGE